MHDWRGLDVTFHARGIICVLLQVLVWNVVVLSCTAGSLHQRLLNWSSGKTLMV